MPLEAKVYLTRARITEFYTGYNTIGYGNAYISFSGGKDSTVLLDIARKMYPEIPAVFSNTGLEYPEIRRFAKAHDNVEVVQPKMPFNEVISRYGYPLIGKEVAEAIYYARKIRSQDVQVERERERKRARGRASDSDECTQEPQNGADGCVSAFYTHTHTHTHKRTDNQAPQDGTQRHTVKEQCPPRKSWTRRRTELNGNLTVDETTNRKAGVTGIPMNRTREIDGSCTDSKAEPG